MRASAPKSIRKTSITGSGTLIDEAMELANRAAEERDPMSLFAKRWPGYTDVLRKHTGYPALMKTLGLE